MENRLICKSRGIIVEIEKKNSLIFSRFRGGRAGKPAPFRLSPPHFDREGCHIFVLKVVLK
jgi:hypothetical protein